ncbi:ribosomal protein S5 domain 2-like protein [Athelia psychrophila]|uniref:Ribosomal protein S5 domain 2-like protein n=1 Tax=Athelia psychrophila TaxID=1759441 RepID=A0A166F5R7_9AGAM|nr:ribosomal protein S5 domain 2-like protein [Fibularhizoctonia sp. CBS 109695]
MRPPSPSLPEREFLLQALHQSLRLDGRAMLEARTPTLTFGPEMGWVDCQMGKTRVLAHTTATMVKPQPERPLEGTITIHSEISPMASSAGEYDSGRPSDEEITITRMLDKVVRRSDAVDKESLCILAGERVWALRLTIHCLADSGNLLDCACLAAIVSLRHFRRPDVEVIGSDVTVHAPTERAPVPLSIHHTPFCNTFAFFPPSPSSIAAQDSQDPLSSPLQIPILDPSHLEQRLCTGTLSIALNAQREICVLQKLGGVPLGAEEVLLAVEVAVRRAKEMNEWVDGRLREDWEGRKGSVEVR